MQELIAKSRLQAQERQQEMEEKRRLDEEYKKSTRERYLSSKSLEAEDVHSLNDLEKPLSRLISEIGPRIEAGAYSLIIGDDASGRIPTIMVGTVIKDIYALRNPTARLPIVRFFTGSTGLSNSEQGVQDKKRNGLTEQLGKVKQAVEKAGLHSNRALIVTDIIESGQSVEEISRALRANGFDVEVATIAFPDTYTDPWSTDDPDVGQYGEAIRDLEDRVGGEIHIGDHTPNFIYASSLAGVKKEIGDVYATSNNAEPERIRAGREMAKNIAHQIAEKYLRGELARDS